MSKFFTDRIKSHEDSISYLKTALEYVQKHGFVEGTAAFHKKYGQVLINSFGSGAKGRVFAKVVTVESRVENVRIEDLTEIGGLNQILNQKEQ